MKSKIFTYLSAFILLTLMLFKVSSLHIYSHQDSSDNIENCETCYFSFQNIIIDFKANSAIIAVGFVVILFNKKISQATTSAISSLELLYARFGRPPPYLR